MSDASGLPASWYDDPTGRFEHRYWDGATWTDHVSTAGVTSTDPFGTSGAPATRLDRFDSAVTIGNEGKAETIDKQLAAVGGPIAGGAGTLFTEPVLIVNQKAKLIELNNQYSVFDQAGNQIAAVNQVGQSTLKKAARLLTSLDQFMTHKLEVSDPAGNVLLGITRPAKVMKSTVIVSDGSGREIGKIAQQNVFGKIKFALQANGQEFGAIKAENWRAWNFRIEDAAGNEVARVTKTWEGLAKTMFTTADNYVVQIHRPLEGPLQALVVAAAVSVDTALKQDSRGFN